MCRAPHPFLKSRAWSCHKRLWRCIDYERTIQKRLDYVYDRLVSMGLDVVKPSGAFYIFPSIKSFGMTSFDFSMALLEDAGVALVPGSSFSTYGEGYVRLSFACSMDTLREGLDRLELFVLKNVKQCRR